MAMCAGLSTNRMMMSLPVANHWAMAVVQAAIQVHGILDCIPCILVW